MVKIADLHFQRYYCSARCLDELNSSLYSADTYLVSVTGTGRNPHFGSNINDVTNLNEWVHNMQMFNMCAE
jgi:hypothetical protein